MKLAAQAVLLFAFIPLVLFLYLRQPLGPGWSIAVGLAIMFGHRFAAAPWAARHAGERCAWCAKTKEAGANWEYLSVDTGASAASPGSRLAPGAHAPGTYTVAACSPAHAASTARFLTFVCRFRLPIALGIFVPLVLLLADSIALAAGRPVIPVDLSVRIFKKVVALAVVTTSMAYLAVSEPAATLRSPFPLHNLLLLGIRNTLWIFRIVGIWWLVFG